MINDFPRLLAAHASQYGDKIAVECGSKSLTYRELDDRSGHFASALQHAGFVAGTRVAFLGKSCTEYFEFLIGSMKAGVVPVPLNWRLAPPEISMVLRDSGAALLVVSSEFAGKIVQTAASLPDLQVTISLSPHGKFPCWEEWIAQHGDTYPVEQVSASDGSALQVYTSGTTGKPKGVITTADAFISYLESLSNIANLTDTSISLSTMPLFHIGGTGWALAGLFRGATVIILRDVDPDKILEIVESHGVTNLIAVPSVIQALLQSPKIQRTDASSLKHIYYGGGPMTENILREAIQQFKCAFVQGFGMTECALISALASKYHFPESPLLRSCGKPIPGTTVRLVDPNTGRDVPQGKVGEIWVNSPQVCLGYWLQPKLTRETIVDRVWLRTGDAAYRNKEGFLFLQDRIKDMIVSGGENVYPAEVENALMFHPDVRECAVIGVPSTKWIETVKAVVVLNEGRNTSAESLIAFCKKQLASYKCPTIIEFAEKLPRNPSGKILKYKLK